MATEMEKDVLIEYISGTMIQIRKKVSPTINKDRTQLKLLRSAVYSLPCVKIKFEKYVDIVKKIRVKYGISN
jgi:hypothetical protein